MYDVTSNYSRFYSLPDNVRLRVLDAFNVLLEEIFNAVKMVGENNG